MYIYSDEYQLGSCVLIASATVLVFDFFLTLQQEVGVDYELQLGPPVNFWVKINHIWMQPWTFGTGIFLVNRYLPFVDTSLVLYLQFTTTHIDMCNKYYRVSTWLIAVGLMVSELILLMRTYAMWQRRRIILYILGGMSFATFGPGIALTYLELKSLEFGEVPEGGLGCRLLKASKLIFVTYVLVALSETGMDSPLLFPSYIPPQPPDTHPPSPSGGRPDSDERKGSSYVSFSLTFPHPFPVPLYHPITYHVHHTYSTPC
ncbi:hypothetical protein NLJ89_g10175 [Agrocybe chaxingu]|uniref:DUF6533 domain-containing protein n=1 Tax=Agrocybe chaxingu TaxID=84603 RepID=A0A9W8JPC3_9AGAR|nr:hypothetical protein NLJ89_g10175 [Agrocybe chaxingu]